jgi:hypothetical protein
MHKNIIIASQTRLNAPAPGTMWQKNYVRREVLVDSEVNDYGCSIHQGSNRLSVVMQDGSLGNLSETLQIIKTTTNKNDMWDTTPGLRLVLILPIHNLKILSFDLTSAG